MQYKIITSLKKPAQVLPVKKQLIVILMQCIMQSVTKKT